MLLDVVLVLSVFVTFLTYISNTILSAFPFGIVYDYTLSTMRPHFFSFSKIPFAIDSMLVGDKVWSD